MTRIAETSLELNNFGDYNTLEVSVSRDDRNNGLTVYFNPCTRKFENGYYTTTFMMFSNGAKRIAVPNVRINRLTAKAKGLIRQILENNKETLMATFNEVTTTNSYPIENTQILDDLEKQFTK